MSSPKPLIRPRALVPGDLIAVIATSGPVDRDSLDRGLCLLQQRGYRVRLGASLLSRAASCNYLAGEDTARAADFTEMFADPEVAAVFCARGGYGAARILRHVHWPTVAASPKLFIGYSDVTTLHLALARHAGLVTVHGKMVCGLDGLSERTADSLWRLIESAEPPGPIDTGGSDPVELVGGIAEGVTAGGCICLLAHACGTDYAPDFTNSLVFLEDVGEPVYRVDRDIVQLIQAANLGAAAGFVIGTVSGWEAHEAGTGNSLLAVWRELLAPLGKPAIYGFPIGHEPEGRAFPIGVRGRLDAGARTVTLLEPAVI